MSPAKIDKVGDGIAYCVPTGQDFQRHYIKIHGYIAITVCLLGSTLNIVNIAVLSRKEMATSTNSILTGLAVADLLVMLDYIPFALHTYTAIGANLNRNSYGWAVFIYFHSIFSQTFHTVSIWLTITLAIWRFIAITFPYKNKTLCSKRNTSMAIITAYVVCPVLCLPIYFAMDIYVKGNVTQIKLSENTIVESINNTADTDTEYALKMTSDEDLLATVFWIYSVLFKLIPCITLSILSVCLIIKMKLSEKKRMLLKNMNASSEVEKKRLCEDTNCTYSEGRSASKTDRTTRMLLALLGLFLTTELPQALFGLLTAFAPHLFEICYYAFGEVMDLMALVGSAVNFVLYCSMSHQFRLTFTRLARKLFIMPRKQS